MRMRTAAAVPLLTAGLLAGCWSSPEPPEQTFVGLRLSEGAPEFWPGRTCEGVSAIEVEVETPQAEPQSWTATAEDGTGTVETVRLGEPPAGFTSTDPAPTWAQDAEVTVAVLGEEGLPYSRSTWSLAEVATAQGRTADGQWLTTLDRWVGEDDVEDLADEGIYPVLCGDPASS